MSILEATGDSGLTRISRISSWKPISHRLLKSPVVAFLREPTKQVKLTVTSDFKNSIIRDS